MPVQKAAGLHSCFFIRTAPLVGTQFLQISIYKLCSLSGLAQQFALCYFVLL